MPPRLQGPSCPEGLAVPSAIPRLPPARHPAGCPVLRHGDGKRAAKIPASALTPPGLHKLPCGRRSPLNQMLSRASDGRRRLRTRQDKSPGPRGALRGRAGPGGECAPTLPEPWCRGVVPAPLRDAAWARYGHGQPRAHPVSVPLAFQKALEPVLASKPLQLNQILLNLTTF